jgi:hypothetical protein
LHIRERVEICKGFWWGNLRERDHLEDAGVNGMIILECNFMKLDVRAWAASMCFSIGTGGRKL